MLQLSPTLQQLQQRVEETVARRRPRLRPSSLQRSRSAAPRELSEREATIAPRSRRPRRSKRRSERTTR